MPFTSAAPMFSRRSTGAPSTKAPASVEYRAAGATCTTCTACAGATPPCSLCAAFGGRPFEWSAGGTVGGGSARFARAGSRRTSGRAREFASAPLRGARGRKGASSVLWGVSTVSTLQKTSPKRSFASVVLGVAKKKTQKKRPPELMDVMF